MHNGVVEGSQPEVHGLLSSNDQETPADEPAFALDSELATTRISKLTSNAMAVVLLNASAEMEHSLLGGNTEDGQGLDYESLQRRFKKVTDEIFAIHAMSVAALHAIYTRK